MKNELQTPQERKVWWELLHNTWQQIFMLNAKISENPNDKELESLLNLERLDCSYQNQDYSLICKLSPIPYLLNLKELDCSGNQVKKITHLNKLKNLQVLDCYNNQISDLIPLQNLVNLQKLDCSGNQITNLSPLYNLVHLQELHLSDNQISIEQINSLKKALPNCFIYS